MNKRVKVIEINGFRGISVIAFAIICACAGFIVFPSWALMHMWNLLGTYIYNLPHMNLLHGFMLYVIFILMYFATNSHKTCLGISSVNLSKSHIASMMNDFEDKK